MKIKVRCNLNQLCTRDGITQKWLAEQIGVDKRFVSKWATNTWPPHAGYLLRICKVTGWRIEELLEEDEHGKN